jgi:hypothetical protein
VASGKPTAKEIDRQAREAIAVGVSGSIAGDFCPLEPAAR